MLRTRLRLGSRAPDRAAARPARLAGAAGRRRADDGGGRQAAVEGADQVAGPGAGVRVPGVAVAGHPPLQHGGDPGIARARRRVRPAPRRRRMRRRCRPGRRAARRSPPAPGAMYAGVPTAAVTRRVDSSALARPKSPRTRKSSSRQQHPAREPVGRVPGAAGLIRMFDGLMSRWTTPRSWIAASAAPSAAATARTSVTVTVPPRSRSSSRSARVPRSASSSTR